MARRSYPALIRMQPRGRVPPKNRGPLPDHILRRNPLPIHILASSHGMGSPKRGDGCRKTVVEEQHDGLILLVRRVTAAATAELCHSSHQSVPNNQPGQCREPIANRRGR